jgi:sugar transferase (PEP-CTERM/EpsH1 system associated)
MRFLARRADVYLGTLAEEPLEAGSLEALRRLCRCVAIEPLGKSRWPRAVAGLACGRSATEGLFQSPSLAATLRTWTNEIEFDAVVVFCSSMGQYLNLPGLKDVPAVVDLVDVDSQKFFDYAAATRGPKKWLYRLEGRRLRALECSLAKRAKAVTLVSEAEADLFREICPEGNTLGVSNGVDLDYFRPIEAEGRADRCVFVGALDYRPNIECIVWFCEHVWPQVRAARPGATLAVVGRRPDPVVSRLTDMPGVDVIGQVPDVRPHLAEAQVAVAPLRIARGIQNKVLEAMAAGRPVVTSPQALEGLAAEPGVHLVQAESPRQWTDEILHLMTTPTARRHLATAARTYVEHHHSWQACLAPFGDLLNLPAISPHPVTIA